MHPRASAAIKSAFYGSGLYTRRLRSVQFPGLAVLCYHGLRAGPPRGTPFEPLQVAVETFERHCRLIRDSCDPIGADMLLAALDGGAPLPARAVLVTFDDGYRTVLTLAKPVLERYGIPAVVFVCSDPIARGRLLWYDAVARTRGEAEVERLKTVPFSEWRDTVHPFDIPAAEGDPYAPLTVDELRRLADGHGIEIGGHTLRHAILSHATADEQAGQIADDKRTIEEWTGRPARFFSYPNGRPRIDYTLATCDVVERCGYLAAFTTQTAYARASSDRYELPRFLMLDSMTAPALAHRLTFGWVAAH
ncbi:MAG TPA: polysaccharide deacetylase family protein [Vicinamibacterales bacterium]